MRPDHSSLKPSLKLPPLPDEWTPLRPPTYLNGTSGHHLWRLKTLSGELIWRQSLQAPGADPHREIQVLQALQSYDWVPDLLFHTPKGDQLLRFYPGQHPERTSLNSGQRLALIQRLIQLWQTPAQLAAMDYSALILDYQQQAQSQPQATLLAQALLNEVAAWSRPLNQLTHHDLHAQNLLLHDKTWMLLDWEYAAPGNPWIDAIALDRMWSLTSEEKQRLETALPCLDIPHPWQQMHQWLDRLDQLWELACQW